VSLTSLWKSQEGELVSKHIQAMVGLAGDGKLRDGSETSKEFREFLTHVPSEMLARYANECLGAEKFGEASAALQDVINEVGRRLGFAVQNGLYRGKVSEIGNDGLWSSDEPGAIILEVKTTDAYTIDLDRLANYRRKLATEDKIDLDKSSILIVVGRSDTDSLEAQVRDSRHAWDIRMISVDALLRLVGVKEGLEDPQVVRKIRQILRPKEYTKVDEIIDLVFSAAEDVKEKEAPDLESEPGVDPIASQIDSATDTEKKGSPANFREGCIARLQTFLHTGFVKRSRACYSSADNKIAVICLTSKLHQSSSGRKGSLGWFAFRPHQKEAINDYQQGYVAFGCGSPDTIILISAKEFVSWVDKELFYVTVQPSRRYWHVIIEVTKSRIMIDTKTGHPRLDVTKYRLN
jgi:hypothetical protein